MTIDDKIKDEKLQYDINREALKILALSSGKIDKYEDLTCEEILPSRVSLIFVERVRLHNLNSAKHLKKKRKQLKNKEKINWSFKIFKTRGI